MDAAIESLRPGLQATLEQLSIDASAGQIDALLIYLSMLRRWNTHYNLTSIRTPAQMLTQHLADCLAVIGPLARETGVLVAGRGQVGVHRARLLDVGSGGGLPGVVIAMTSPSIDVTCVDTVGKKVAFVRQVAGELMLPNLHALHSRAEQIHAEPYDVVTSRAFASLADFTVLTQPLLAFAGVWMAMKGKPPDREIEALPDTIDVFHVEQLNVPGLDAERCIVWMRSKP